MGPEQSGYTSSEKEQKNSENKTSWGRRFINGLIGKKGENALRVVGVGAVGAAATGMPGGVEAANIPNNASSEQAIVRVNDNKSNAQQPQLVVEDQTLARRYGVPYVDSATSTSADSQMTGEDETDPTPVSDNGEGSQLVEESSDDSQDEEVRASYQSVEGSQPTSSDSAVEGKKEEPVAHYESLSKSQIEENFRKIWEQLDWPVANGTSDYSWFLGPEPIAQIEMPYREAPGGKRLVWIFDKGGLEDNSYREANFPWLVTKGLYAKQLVEGRVQRGDNEFEDRVSPDINIAGDPNDPNAPTYASFSKVLKEGPTSKGQIYTKAIRRDGQTGQPEDNKYARHGVQAGLSVHETNHSIAAPFEEYMVKTSGKAYGNMFYDVGFPISEAYWTTVMVNGKPTDVLVQVFERKTLTYTPSNEGKWKVENGNVGRHYHEWLNGAVREAAYASSSEQREQLIRQRISEAGKSFDTTLARYLQEKDTPAFDRTYKDGLPAQYGQYEAQKRWFMGAYLTNTGLMYGLSGDIDSADEYIKKGWKYTKEKIALSGERLPDNRTPSVFPLSEYVVALRFIGNDLKQKDPQLVNEILSYMEEVANHYASRSTPGNSAENVKTDTYGETNAGIAAFLVGMASIEPNNQNRNQWISSSYNYAKGALAVNEQIGGQQITTAVKQGDELWLYNHGYRNAAYTLTTVGQLGLAEFLARTGGIPAGTYFRNNVDQAVRTVMKYVDPSTNLYTLPENRAFRGYDEYLLKWYDQSYSTYGIDTNVITQMTKELTPNYQTPNVAVSEGAFSPGFQENVDPNFRGDLTRYLESDNYLRILLKDLMCQQMLGQDLTVAGRGLSLFSDTTRQ